MTTLTLYVMMAPPRELSPNASRLAPLGMKIRLKREWKQAWFDAAVDAVEQAHPGTYQPSQPAPYFTGPVVMDVVSVLPYRGKSWDDDNLIACLKYGRDQLQTAFLVADDKDIRIGDVTQRKAEADEEPGSLIVTLDGERA